METSEGTIRLFPDVMVEPSGDEEWVATGREAAVPGETLILDVVPLGTTELRQRLPVRVIDSRPVILDGDLRYRIRLHSDTEATVLFEQQIRRG